MQIATENAINLQSVKITFYEYYNILVLADGLLNLRTPPPDQNIMELFAPKELCLASQLATAFRPITFSGMVGQLYTSPKMVSRTKLVRRFDVDAAHLQNINSH